MGAPEAVQAAYLIERRLDLPYWAEPIYQARNRASGKRVWLKCSDGSADSVSRIGREGRLLKLLAHPNVLPSAATDGPADAACLAYPWGAEAPLESLAPAGWSAPDRARLALALQDVVSHLQSLPEPVAHTSLRADTLWVTPGIHWLKLVGFGSAVEGASPEQLQADREAAWRIICQLAGPSPSSQGGSLDEAGRDWVEHGEASADALKRALKLSLLEYVTTDL
jgi:hypothetical protein